MKIDGDKLIDLEGSDDSDEYDDACEDQEEASKKEFIPEFHKKKKGKASRLAKSVRQFFGAMFRPRADKKKSSRPPDDADVRSSPEDPSEIARLRMELKRLQEQVDQYKNAYIQLNTKMDELSEVKFQLCFTEMDCTKLREELQLLSANRDKLKSELHKQDEMHRSEKRRLHENFEMTEHARSGLIVQLEETIAALKRDLAIAQERVKTVETENVQLQQKIDDLEDERNTAQILLDRSTAAVLESRRSRHPVTEL